MLKVIIYDSGCGGELFTDRLEEALPVIEIIKIIDWRHAQTILRSSRRARKIAEATLQPYIGKADLIVFANHLLSTTSLKYFQRKYPLQKFIGLKLFTPDTFVDRDILILSTKSLARTRSFRRFVSNIKRTTKVLTPDSWLVKIDDGELRAAEIKYTIDSALKKHDFYPKEIILTCSHFSDIKTELKEIFGGGTKVYDSFDIAIREIYKQLGLRGGISKKS